MTMNELLGCVHPLLVDDDTIPEVRFITAIEPEEPEAVLEA